VAVIELFGFASFLLMLMADDFFGLPKNSTLGRRWGLVEIFAGALIAGLTMRLTQRLMSRLVLLDGLVSICMYCKKVRNEDKWEPVEKYVSARSKAKFTHGMCPNCYIENYPESTKHE
jgi:hypothetical protein